MVFPIVALEPAWRNRLDALARARGWPRSTDVAPLARGVAELSRSYNEVFHAPRGRLTVELEGARLGFFFPRDLIKAEAAVRELASAQLLAPAPGRPLRILDLGAGLGATTFGVLRAIGASDRTRAAEAVALDVDRGVLETAREIAASEPGLTLDTRVGDVCDGLAFRDIDVVLLGQVLCELDRDLAAEAREERHAALLARLVAQVITPNGVVVVIDPALRELTRHLHRVRDRLVAAGIHVFAPCPHARACPVLARESDWCHEHVDVALPEWLVPVARAAGLRWEGLTFSYLVLRRESARGFGGLRVVSEPRISKGRRDLFLCGEATDGRLLRKVGRLDRHASEENAVWSELRRGDLVEIEGASPERIAPETRVRRARFRI